MPFPSARSFVGVAVDANNGYISTAVAAAATSVTLTGINGTIGSTGSLIIVDGVNTETVTISANSSGTLTVSALSYAHAANTYCYYQSSGNVGPTAYVPLTKFTLDDDYTQLYDEGYRGSMAKHYGVTQGMRGGKVTFDGDLFADTFGYFLGCLMGSYDYTATTGGNPTKYAFSPKNVSGSNDQPPNYLFYVYNPAGASGGAGTTRVFAVSSVIDLTVKIDPAALMTYTVNIQAYASGLVANPGTLPPTFSSFTPVPSRVASASLDSTNTQLVESAEITFKREEAGPIMTIQGIQDPLEIFVGPLTVTGKITMVMNDETQLKYYLNGTQSKSLTLTANQGSGTAANGLTVQVTKPNWEQVKVLQQGKAYVQVELPFTAIANTTDASTAGSGLSPAKVTLSTGTTTGATQYG